MDNFTQMQMNDTREIDVTTPSKPDLQQFTPEEIEEHCEKVLNKCLFIPLEAADGKLLFEGVQIIRQLQGDRV